MEWNRNARVCAVIRVWFNFFLLGWILELVCERSSEVFQWPKKKKERKDNVDLAKQNEMRSRMVCNDNGHTVCLIMLDIKNRLS